MSRQLDSMLKGLAIFKQGMQEMAVGTAIDDANKELAGAREVFSGEEDEKNMSDAKNRIAQSLSSRLAASGASASRIASATSFGLSAFQEASLESKAVKTAATIANTATIAKTKQTSRGEDIGIKRFDKFTGAVKENIKAVESFDTNLQQLSQFKGKGLVVELIKSGTIKAVEGGRVTDQDINRMAADTGELRKFLRSVGLESKGEISKDEDAFWNSFVTSNRDKLIKDVRNTRDSFLSSTKAIAPSADVSGLETATAEHIASFKTSTEQSSDEVQRQIEVLEAGKASRPAAQQQAIEARIKQLKQGR